MNTEIHIEGYRLDITNDIAALLNFAIDDIKNFSSRSTTWSRTIVLPGTANNNRLFGHIFQPGQSNGYDASQPNVGYNYNASKAARCIIFQDQVQAFKGVLRLLQINMSDGFQGRVEYEVSIFGTLTGLNVALTSALLEDLDFSAYNHTYNDGNIVASWDNPGGSGYYYPLIDYGTYSTNKHDWDIKTFRPALYVREFIDKIFTDAGYRWSSALFDTPRFKTFIIPYNKKLLTITTTNVYGANKSGTQLYTFDSSSPPPSIPINYEVQVGGGFSANGANTVFTFNGTVTTTVKLKLRIAGSFVVFGFAPAVVLAVYKNGESGTILHWSGISIVATPFDYQVELNFSIAQNETIEFRLIGSPNEQVTLTIAEWNVTTAVAVTVPVAVGDPVIMNETLPKNIRQIDFLIAIVKLFNLYVYEDKYDETLIYFTPYIDYYSKNFSNAVDWTHKLNRNKVTKVKPMSELNAKIYKFKFKPDSDYYNDLYRKRYNEGYGDRIYDSEFEFTQQTSEFEICFSGTPLVGYFGEDKVYPTIFKRNGSDSSPAEENVDSNIRILQSKKITGITPWNITTNSGATTVNTLTRYGYAGHLDDPGAPANDLNFGAPKELFFSLTAGNISNNQFNVYWSNYMREITDKDSKLVIANFYLTTKDILNLDFSKYIYVEGIAFRLNSISDYNATKPADCVVELLKVNSASYSESTSNDGPPAGCYLLWSDENTLDWDDGEPLLYSDCTNPGDGNPPSGDYQLTWSFTKTSSIGGMKVYKNNILIVSTNSNGSNGVFVIDAADEIKIELTGSLGGFGLPKRIFVSNDVDGVIYDSTSAPPVKTHTFIVGANKNYTVVGEVNN